LGFVDATCVQPFAANVVPFSKPPAAFGLSKTVCAGNCKKRKNAKPLNKNLCIEQGKKKFNWLALMNKWMIDFKIIYKNKQKIQPASIAGLRKAG